MARLGPWVYLILALVGFIGAVVVMVLRPPDYQSDLLFAILLELLAIFLLLFHEKDR